MEHKRCMSTECLERKNKESGTLKFPTPEILTIHTFLSIAMAVLTQKLILTDSHDVKRDAKKVIRKMLVR